MNQCPLSDLLSRLRDLRDHMEWAEAYYTQRGRYFKSQGDEEQSRFRYGRAVEAAYHKRQLEGVIRDYSRPCQ